jgi:DNA-binding transcriptional LysR family regulator
VFSGWSDDLRRRLREGHLDAAVTVTVETADGPPVDNDLVVVAQAETTMTDLTAVRWVLSPAPCEVRTWLKAQLAERGGTLDVTAEAQDPALQLMMVREGMGFGFVPRHMAERNFAGAQILATPGFRSRLVSRLERATPAARHAPVLAFIDAEAVGGKLADMTSFHH